FPNHDFAPEFAAVIFDGTEGNPLFMADLLSDLRKGGLIINDGRNWSLSTEIAKVQEALTANMRALIESKINRLSDPDRRLLNVAAIQGAEFDAGVVASILEMDNEV